MISKNYDLTESSRNTLPIQILINNPITHVRRNDCVLSPCPNNIIESVSRE